MDIRQLSIHYHIEQDRILIRVNSSAGDEVHMWLTRRMALRLWPLINQVVVDHFAVPTNAHADGAVDLSAIGPQTRAVLADARREEAVQNADFSTPYRDTATNHPLGYTPLLVTEVNLTPKADGVMHMNFRELLEDPPSTRSFQLDLQADMVFVVLQLLGKALAQAEWNLDPTATALTVKVEEEPADEADFAPDAPRPTYLN
jgi:hypothetical protein